MLYNLVDLKEITDGDDELLKEIILQFITDISDSVSSLQAAIPERDFTTIKFNAHRIRPALVSLNIASLHDVALDIETKADDAIMDEDLVQQIQTVASTLTQVIENLSNENFM